MSKILTKEEIVSLKDAHRLVANKRIADWIKAILMVDDGYGYGEIERVLLLNESTVRRAIKRFKKRGVNGLLETKYIGGNNKLLTNAEEKQIKVFLEINTQQTTIEIRDHIKTVYQVKYSLSGVTKLLHRLGFTYKKPKIIPGKADLKKQDKFIKKYNRVKENLRENDRIYFGDASHPTHNTKADYGWILKGKKNDKWIKSNTGRKRLNLNGVINLKHQEAIVLSEETINADAVISLLEKIKKKQPKGKAYLIWDNARYHHAKKVKEWLNKNKRFKILFLPPYSPNLNIIERLWRFYHKKVTASQYFESFEEFKRKTLDFFKNLKKYKKELSSLLTDNFQTFDPVHLHS